MSSVRLSRFKVSEQRIHNGINNPLLIFGQGGNALQPVECGTVDLGRGLAHQIVNRNFENFSELDDHVNGRLDITTFVTADNVSRSAGELTESGLRKLLPL